MILFPSGSAAAFGDTVISLNGLLQQVEVDGVSWTVQSMDGWRLGGGVVVDFADRPGRHGNYDGPVYRRARVVTFQGTALATSRLLAERACETLAAVLADGSSGTIAVQNPLGLRSVSARLSDTPQAELISPVAFRWAMQFTAPDHRKYGEAQSTTTSLSGGGTGLTFPIGAFFDFGDPGSQGQVAITNSGTAPTEPRIVVVGPLASGFQITQTDTGRRLVYPSSVVTDVVIDCAEGTATSGGQDRTGLLTVDEFFTIGPGQTSTFQFSTLGAEAATDPASMTVTASPAYY